ncbi:hypothetical protein GCM10010278_71790 [Streptomyces melanogenes]|nr:hypothetical protein GCM10010278_71790 [Streptomyces melanogenes]
MVAGGRDALLDQEPGGLEPAEELRLASGAGHGLADGLAQLLLRWAIPALALGLAAFGAGGALGGGAVAGCDTAQPVVGFDAAGLGLGAAGFVVPTGAAAVVAYQGGDDVDVVIRVADRRPPAGGVVAVGGDAGGGDHAAGDGGPVLVGQDGVLGGCAYGQVPHVLGGAPALGQGVDGLVEQALQLLVGGVRVAAGVGGERVEGGDQVRVGVLWRDTYSQSRRLKMKYRLTHAPAISRIANGYPAAHFNSGMFSKFIP